MKLLSRRASPGSRIVVPRCWRICLLVRLIMPCRLPAWVARTLPVAVMVNRFLADDLVFILGILLFLREASKTATACPLPRPDGSKRGRVYRARKRRLQPWRFRQSASIASPWRQHHKHLPTLDPWIRLDLAHRRGV